MPLPSSGPLSLANIQTEFGGTNPISLNEYYAGGARVPAGTTGTFGPVPSSGAISIRNFYGTTAFIPFGESAYTSVGDFSFVVPAGITQISAVAVGGGGSSVASGTGGGGGGALSYTNDIPVTPGESLTVRVGKNGFKPPSGSGSAAQASGGTSAILRGSTVLLQAAPSTGTTGSAAGQQGVPGLASQGIGAVRYSGGFGKTSSNLSGGGGAAGYAGNGGNGGAQGVANATAGSGGGGGGGGGGRNTRSNSGAGGVGILGIGANGAAGLTWPGQTSATDGTGGGGGSGGQTGGIALGTYEIGGNYGGGSGAENDNNNQSWFAGTGAVRIIWGTGKSYPSNAT